MALFGKRPFTIGELMNIDYGRQERSQTCTVELEGTYHQLQPETLADKLRSFFTGKTHLLGYFLILKLKVTSLGKEPKTVYIKLNPDFNLNRWESNRVKIYCNCPDFKYRSAYILNERKSLFLNDKTKTELGPSLTDSPKKGAKTSFLCKHAYAALSWLVNNYPSIMRSV
jgi:hypothetical protein